MRYPQSISIKILIEVTETFKNLFPHSFKNLSYLYLFVSSARCKYRIVIVKMIMPHHLLDCKQIASILTIKEAGVCLKGHDTDRLIMLLSLVVDDQAINFLCGRIYQDNVIIDFWVHICEQRCGRGIFSLISYLR